MIHTSMWNCGLALLTMGETLASALEVAPPGIPTRHHQEFAWREITRGLRQGPMQHPTRPEPTHPVVVAFNCLVDIGQINLTRFLWYAPQTDRCSIHGLYSPKTGV